MTSNGTWPDRQRPTTFFQGASGSRPVDGVAVADTADLQRLVVDEFTSRPEVARVETRLIFQQWDCGPLLPPATQG